MLRTLPIAFWVCVVAGCTTHTDFAEGLGDHAHRITTTVTVTDTEVLPTASVDIPVLSTVVWRNRGTRPLQIDIEATSCGSCETVMGFEATTNGARSLAIAPGSVATICFHTVGEFPFVAQGGERRHTGVIRVGAAQ